MYHAPKGKGYLLPRLTSHLWVGKKRVFHYGHVWRRKTGFFRVLLDVSSPRQTEVRLGKGVNLPTKDWFYAQVKGRLAKMWGQ